MVKPLFFPGGDIGSLAVHGTVNDLAMGGATPLYLSVAFIIEEGFSMESLRRITASLGRAAAACGVQVVTGDTKVVDKGSGDGVFINTTGLGVMPEGVHLSAGEARPGDAVILSGYIGDHGIAILAEREGIEFETQVKSDSAPLHTLVADMLATTHAIRCLRDPTRGGVSSSLNEIAAQSGVGILLDERAIPVREEVRGACEMLGLDPLYVANEGKLLAIADASVADQLVEVMRRHPLGHEARRIGTVEAERPRLGHHANAAGNHAHRRHAGRRSASAHLLGATMHEMSIATSLLDAIGREAQRHPGSRVLKVCVRIGEWSGVDPQSLQFCFDALVAGAEPPPPPSLEIDFRLRQNRCPDCGNVFAPKDYQIECPGCGAAVTEPVGGQELELAYVELEEP